METTREEGNEQEGATTTTQQQQQHQHSDTTTHNEDSNNTTHRYEAPPPPALTPHNVNNNAQRTNKHTMRAGREDVKGAVEDEEGTGWMRERTRRVLAEDVRCRAGAGAGVRARAGAECVGDECRGTLERKTKRRSLTKCYTQRGSKRNVKRRSFLKHYTQSFFRCLRRMASSYVVPVEGTLVLVARHQCPSQIEWWYQCAVTRFLWFQHNRVYEQVYGSYLLLLYLTTL